MALLGKTECANQSKKILQETWDSREYKRAEWGLMQESNEKSENMNTQWVIQGDKEQLEPFTGDGGNTKYKG